MYFGQRKVKNRNDKNLCGSRFRGVAENNRPDLPKKTPHTQLWKQCIDPAWAVKNTSRQDILDATPDAQNLTVFSLNIRDEHLFDDDKAEWADDEGES